MVEVSDEAIEAVTALVIEIESDGHHTPDPECSNRLCRALYLLRSEIIEPYVLAHQPVSENGNALKGG